VSFEPLRVAIVSPCWFPVPPTGYGGIEWIVALLADGLADAGHEVTLFASGDSRTEAKLAAVYETARSEWIGHTYWELRHTLSALSRAGDFDVINDHTGMLGLLLGGLVETPVVHTVHGPLDGEPGEMYEQICSVVPNALLISISMNQRKPKPDLPWIGNCPNAIEFSLYPVQPHRGDYLLFLGRMSWEKGCHRAVATAIETGAAAEDRRQEARAARGRVLPPVRRGAPLRPDRVPRRGHARREGGAAPERAGDAVPDRVGGAVRARHDRVDGVWDARDRDPLGRRHRGDRARPHRHRRRRLLARLSIT
jgi:hypothetical protein